MHVYGSYPTKEHMQLGGKDKSFVVHGPCVDQYQTLRRCASTRVPVYPCTGIHLTSSCVDQHQTLRTAAQVPVLPSRSTAPVWNQDHSCHCSGVRRRAAQGCNKAGMGGVVCCRPVVKHGV